MGLFWHLNQNFLSALLTQDCLKGCGNDALFIAEIFLCAYFAVALTQKKMVKYGKRLSDCASSRLRELIPRGQRESGPDYQTQSFAQLCISTLGTGTKPRLVL